MDLIKALLSIITGSGYLISKSYKEDKEGTTFGILAFLVPALAVGLFALLFGALDSSDGWLGPTLAFLMIPGGIFGIYYLFFVWPKKEQERIQRWHDKRRDEWCERARVIKSQRAEIKAKIDAGITPDECVDLLCAEKILLMISSDEEAFDLSERLEKRDVYWIDNIEKYKKKNVYQFVPTAVWQVRPVYLWSAINPIHPLDPSMGVRREICIMEISRYETHDNCWHDCHHLNIVDYKSVLHPESAPDVVIPKTALNLDNM